MKNAYLKNLSGLLAKDGVGPENIELVLSWANYQPLHLSGNLNRVAFEKNHGERFFKVNFFHFHESEIPW